MLLSRLAAGILAAWISLLAADQTAVDAWKKPASEWTADDAHQILTDSPWVKTVTPALDGTSRGDQRSTGRRNGGISIGIPGVGGLGRPGRYPGGYPGGGYPGGSRYPGGGRPGGNYPDDSGSSNRTETVTLPMLTVRWESALPVRAAELRSRDVDAPTVDERHYAIAVLGVPRSTLRSETGAMERELKKQAVLKRDGKKDFKPSSVQILQRDDGPVIVYFFSRTSEISSSDRHVEFDAQIGRFRFSGTFDTQDMMYDGKLAL